MSEQRPVRQRPSQLRNSRWFTRRRLGSAHLQEAPPLCASFGRLPPGIPLQRHSSSASFCSARAGGSDGNVHLWHPGSVERDRRALEVYLPQSSPGGAEADGFLVLPVRAEGVPGDGRFLGRITWDGNVHKDDASVMLHNVSPKDNGTFQCHVKNPPDVDGVIGEIQLSVVLKRNFSEVHILILTIGISCVVMVILVVVMVIWRHWRRMHQDKTREVGRSEQLKLKESGEEKDTPLPGQGTRRS